MSREDFGAKLAVFAVLAAAGSSSAPPVEEAESLASRLGLARLVAATMNDDLPALYFYQWRGSRLSALIPDSVVAHTRQVAAGFAGIPMRDEVRLEKRI
jgi:hypothetical protein